MLYCMKCKNRNGQRKGKIEMSQETYDWLSRNVLAGFGVTRRPWWSKGDEANVYDGPVPLERVKELLCSWQPFVTGLLAEDEVMAAVSAGLTGDDLVRAIGTAKLNSHKLVKADD